MNKNVLQSDFFLSAGYIYLPAEPIQICSVIASGIGLTVYDSKQKRGGMAHYLQPFRKNNSSTAFYAAPAILTLANMLLDNGATQEDLEAQIYGGAVNTEALNYTKGISENNIKVALEILDKIGLSITGQDVGGHRARKIMFHTQTGEIMVAKVDNVRESDWYPEAGISNMKD